MKSIDTDQLVPLVQAQLDSIQALYLFGSHAHGDNQPDSDIDIAVLAEKPLTDQQRWLLAESLANALSCDVDVVDLRTANTVMRLQILSTAKQLYRQPDSPALEAFEDFVYADYVAFNEARASLLADIAERGAIR